MIISLVKAFATMVEIAIPLLYLSCLDSIKFDSEEQEVIAHGILFFFCVSSLLTLVAIWVR